MFFFLVIRNSSNKRRIGGAELIRGRRLLTFLSQMRRLFEGDAYSSKYGNGIMGLYKKVKIKQKYLSITDTRTGQTIFFLSAETVYLTTNISVMTEITNIHVRTKLRRTSHLLIFIFQVFAGNTDQNSIVKNSLSVGVKARFVRFYPVTHSSHPCLMVEIFVLK